MRVIPAHKRRIQVEAVPPADERAVVGTGQSGAAGRGIVRKGRPGQTCAVGAVVDHGCGTRARQAKVLVIVGLVVLRRAFSARQGVEIRATQAVGAAGARGERDHAGRAGLAGRGVGAGRVGAERARGAG